jgi:hypothetical protein
VKDSVFDEITECIFDRVAISYRLASSEKRKASLMARFDRIFTRQTGFVTLDRLLKRLHANKAELLKVLERPEIPLHANGSENDIRSHVTKRKVSGGTRSDIGRDCRDGFLGLAKTCKKLGILFWDYLGSRLGFPGQPHVPSLASNYYTETVRRYRGIGGPRPFRQTIALAAPILFGESEAPTPGTAQHAAPWR